MLDGFGTHQKKGKFPVGGPGPPLKSWVLGVVRLQIYSSSIRLPKYVEIQMMFGTYCRQDLFHNDTMVLLEVRSAAVYVGAEVVEQRKSGRCDKF